MVFFVNLTIPIVLKLKSLPKMSKNGTNNLSYKIVITIFILLITCFIIYNFSNKENRQNIELKFIKNKVTVVPKINWIIDWNNQPAKKKIIYHFANEHDFLHQNIKLNLLADHELNRRQHAREIVKMIENNIFEYDIFWIDETVYYLIGEYLNNKDWGNEYLVNFQNIEGFTLTQRSEIIQNKNILEQYGNIIPGPFLDGFYGVLWYNKKTADLLGLEIKDREMNMEDLLIYAKRIKEYNTNNNKNIALFSEAKDWFNFSNIFFQHLVWNELENKSKTDTVDSILNYNFLKKILDYFESLSEYDPLISSHNVNMWYDAERAFLNDEALFLIGTTNNFNELFSIDSINFQKILPAELPSFGNNRGYIGNFQPLFAVFKSAPQRDAAIELGKVINSPNYAEEWTKLTKCPTGISVNIKENYLENDPYNKFLIYIAKKYQYNVRYSIDAGFITGNKNTSLYSINENVRKVLSRQLKSDDAFNKIISNLSE